MSHRLFPKHTADDALAQAAYRQHVSAAQDVLVIVRVRRTMDALIPVRVRNGTRHEAEVEAVRQVLRNATLLAGAHWNDQRLEAVSSDVGEGVGVEPMLDIDVEEIQAARAGLHVASRNTR